MNPVTFRLLALAAFVSGANLRLVDPLLPELAASFGVGVPRAGVVVTAFTLGYALAQLVHGPLGDRIGRLATVRAAMLVAAAGAAASAAAPGLAALAGLRFLTAAGAAAIVPLGFAWVGDHTDYAERQPNIARLVAAMLAGQLCGPLIGGLAADWVGWRAAFAALAAVFLATAMGLGRGSEARPAATGGHPLAPLATVLASPWARRVLALVALEGALFWGAFAFAGAWLHQRFALSFTATGALVAGFGVGGLVFTAAVRPLLSRLGERGLVLAGGLLLAVTWSLLSCAATVTVAAALMVAAGFGYYLCHNTFQARATEMVPSARGSAVSLFGLALFGGQAAGVGIAAWTIVRFGYPPTFAAAGIGLAATAAAFAAALARERRRGGTATAR